MRLRILIFICFVLIFLAPNLSEAKGEGPNNERKIVPAGEVIKEDYSAVGEVVEISGTVEGDVYVAGGQLFIDGTVDGDVLALGAIVNISGTVTQDVRVLGGQVVVSGEIGRNATMAAMNITFTESAQVKGNVVAGGANVTLASNVGKEVRASGRNFTLTGAIEGDLEAAFENIRFGEKARVGGDLTYWSNQEALFDEGASVRGTTIRKSPKQLFGRFEEMANPALHLIKPFLGLSSFFATLILGLLLVHFFPGYAKATARTLRARPWRSLMAGVTMLVLIPVVFGLLIITIVGIPLGFFLLLLSSLILYASRIFAMLLIGQIVLERLGKHKGDKATFSVGLIAYSLFSIIPVVGWIVPLGAVLFGLGAAVKTLKEMYGKRNKSNA